MAGRWGQEYALDYISLAIPISWLTECVVTPQFSAWYEGLDDGDTDAVYLVVSLLEAKGTNLPYPYSSAIKGSSVAMRELRVQSGGRPLRILYAFDPKRQALLLLGGDKTGDDRFYERMIPEAERLWRDYLLNL